MANVPKRLDNSELEKYDKRCDTIQKLLIDFYEDVIESFVKDESTGYNVVVFKSYGTLTILPTNTWREIQRNVVAKLEKNKSPFCSICSSVKNKIIACNKCSKTFCTECYIDSFRANKGLVVCYHCAYSFGITMSDEAVEDKIEDIQEKIEDQS